VIPLSQNRDEVFILPHGEELKHQVKYGNRFADEQTTDGMIFNENRLRQGNVQIRSHSAHQSKKKRLLICSPKMATLHGCAVRVQNCFSRKIREQFANKRMRRGWLHQLRVTCSQKICLTQSECTTSDQGLTISPVMDG
jgi:hypothetical protein